MEHKMHHIKTKYFKIDVNTHTKKVYIYNITKGKYNKSPNFVYHYSNIFYGQYINIIFEL